MDPHQRKNGPSLKSALSGSPPPAAAPRSSGSVTSLLDDCPCASCPVGVLAVVRFLPSLSSSHPGSSARASPDRDRARPARLPALMARGAFKAPSKLGRAYMPAPCGTKTHGRARLGSDSRHLVSPLYKGSPLEQRHASTTKMRIYLNARAAPAPGRAYGLGSVPRSLGPEPPIGAEPEVDRTLSTVVSSTQNTMSRVDNTGVCQFARHRRGSLSSSRRHEPPD